MKKPWNGVRCVLAIVVLAGVAAAPKAKPDFLAIEKAVRAGSVNFSFDQVDVRTFAKLVGELTEKKIVVTRM